MNSFGNWVILDVRVLCFLLKRNVEESILKQARSPRESLWQSGSLFCPEASVCAWKEPETSAVMLFVQEYVWLFVEFCY